MIEKCAMACQQGVFGALGGEPPYLGSSKGEGFFALTVFLGPLPPGEWVDTLSHPVALPLPHTGHLGWMAGHHPVQSTLQH